MTLPTWIRSERVGTHATVRLPERIPGTWSALLLAVDALVAVVGVLLVGLPGNAAPAVCLIICGCSWLVGGDHVSYAIRSRDEAYHAVATIVLAAVPLEFVLIGLGDFNPLQSIAVLPFMLALLCPLHIGAHVLRGGGTIRDGAADNVSPRAKRRVTSPAFRVCKRAVDLILSSIGVVLLAPVMLAAAFAISRESTGKVLFAQERIGRDRHRFTIYKFRTMREGAGEAWAKPGDDRITKFGAFLRRTSLDELPQLINVLRGDMSLIGPRPEMPEYAHDFRQTIGHYDERVLVDPGMTGWAQIHLERNLQPSDMAEVVPYDLFYVEHSSFALDLYVAIKTVFELAFHRAV